MDAKEYTSHYWTKKTGLLEESFEDDVNNIKKYYPYEEWIVDFTVNIIINSVNIEKLQLITWDHVDLSSSVFHIETYDGELKQISIPKKMRILLENIARKGTSFYVFSGQQRLKDKIGCVSLLLTGMSLLESEGFEKIKNQKDKNPKLLENLSPNQTRFCLKAWNQVEITATGNLLPCCIMPYSLYHIDEKESAEKGLRHLRQSLLDGKLNSLCKSCYITPIVEKETLIDTVKALQMENKQDDLLAPMPIKDLRIYTSDKCNLRCTYCTISDADYVGHHMSDDVFKHALELAQDADKNAEIHLNGHGEATFHPKWREYFTQLLETRRTLFLTTNLASKYKESDYELLAKLDKIYVSLDSDDDEMMMNIRKKIQPKVIYERIQKIQDAAQKLNIVPPIIEMSIGVYNPSIWKMEEFMQKLITLGIQGVGFWQMKEVTSNRKATSIIHLTEKETQKARAIFHKSVQILKQNNLTVSIAQDLICSDGLPLYQENLISENNKQKKKQLSLFQRLLGNSITKK